MREGYAILFIFLLLAISVGAQDGDNKADRKRTVTGVIKGELKYKLTEIHLNTLTEYMFVFHNNDPFTSHNLRIQVSEAIEFLIRVFDNDKINGRGGPNAIWEGQWTADGQQRTMYFYCGFRGHTGTGMNGTIYVENSSDSNTIDTPQIIAGDNAMTGIIALALGQLSILYRKRINYIID